MDITPEERDLSLMQTVGATWSDIAARHEMRCGACVRGTLALHEVHATLALWPPSKGITVVLHCDTCGMTFEMPYQKQEETFSEAAIYTAETWDALLARKRERQP